MVKLSSLFGDVRIIDSYHCLTFWCLAGNEAIIHNNHQSYSIIIPFPSIPIHSHPFPSIPIHSHPFPSIPIHSHPFPSIPYVKRTSKTITFNQWPGQWPGRLNKPYIWNMFFYIFGMSSPQLTFTPSFFRGVGLNHQPDHIDYIYIYIIPIITMENHHCLMGKSTMLINYPMVNKHTLKITSF